MTEVKTFPFNFMVRRLAVVPLLEEARLFRSGQQRLFAFDELIIIPENALEYLAQDFIWELVYSNCDDARSSPRPTVDFCSALGFTARRGTN